MRIFVFEFFSGGGSASQDVLNSILSEGYAMLSSIITDFHGTKLEIISSLDYRVKRFNPPLLADEIIEISNNDDFNTKFDEILAQDIDTVFLIAPETDKILFSLAKKVEDRKIPLLGPSAASIEITTDKYQTNKKIENVASIPRTEIISIDISPERLFQLSKNFGFPFIMKPLDGVACAGISLIRKKEDILQAISRIKEASKKREFIIQEYINGIDVSLSLLIGNNRIIPLTLNYQNINLQSSDSISMYQGGYTPFEHPLKEEVIAQSKKIVEKIKGLKGYIGIDYVLTSEKVFFMEINPRLTTSYVGIRVVSKQNIAENIINLTFFNKEEIPPFEFHGYSTFSKVDLTLPNLDLKKFQEKYFKKEIIAPPFVIEGKEKELASAFIYSYHEDLNECKKQFEIIKNKLLLNG